DAVRWFEKIPDHNPDALGADEAVMMFFSRVLVFDHVRHQIHIIANVFTEGKTQGLESEYKRAVDDIEAMAARLEDPIDALPRRKLPEDISLRSNMTKRSSSRLSYEPRSTSRRATFFR